MGRIDDALARWPAPERSALEWDEMAERTLSRAVSEARSGPDADLLDPPLPATAGERPRRVSAAWWAALGAVGAVAAIAAGVFVVVPRPTTSDATAAAQAVAAPPAQPRPQAPSVIPAGDRGVDPSDLPRAASVETRGPAATGRPGAAPRAAAAEPVLAEVPKAGPGTAPPLPLSAAPSAPLQPAAAVAAGSGLAGGPDSVPIRPSVGAIQSALGIAGRGARACLAAGDAPSHAMVTFRSDGSVSEVAVSGVAAGSPAEDCIRAALAKARVPPFAAATFAAPVTVRPD